MDIQDTLTSITTVADERFLVEALDLATLAHWTKVCRNLERSSRHSFVSLPQNMHLTVRGDGIVESLSPPSVDLQELNGNVKSAIAFVLPTTESQLPVTVKYAHGPPVPPPDTPLRAIGFGDSVLLYMDFSDNRKDSSPNPFTKPSLSLWDWFTVTAGNYRSASSYATKSCKVLEGALSLATSLESDGQLQSVSIPRDICLIGHDDGHVKSLPTPDTDLEVLRNPVESVTSLGLPKTDPLQLVSVVNVQEPPVPPQDTPLRVIGFGNSVLLYMDFGDIHKDPSPKPSARKSSSRWDRFTVVLRNRLSSMIYDTQACGLLEDTLSMACASPKLTQSDCQLSSVSIPRDVRLTVHGDKQVKSLSATVADLEVLNEPVESVTAPAIPTTDSPSPVSVVHVYEPPAPPPDTPLRAIGFGDSVLLYIDFGDSHDDPSPTPSARRSSSRLNRITAPIRNFFRRLPFNFCSGRRH